MSELDKYDDFKLVEAAQAGDNLAFEVLIHRYYKPIFNFIYQGTAHLQDSQDMTQEVFIRAYTKIHQFRYNLNFRSWLFKIATNLIRDRHRSKLRRQREKQLEESSPDLQDNTEVASVEERLLLWSLIPRLPDDQRNALTLWMRWDGSESKVAEILGITIEKARMDVFHAKQKLKQMLREEPPDISET